MEDISIITGRIINFDTLCETMFIKTPATKDEPVEHLALYNYYNLGYQICGWDASDVVSGYEHNLLHFLHPLDNEAIKYIVQASVYSAFSQDRLVIGRALKDQRDFSTHDKELLDGYINRQYNLYKGESDNVKHNYGEIPVHDKLEDKVFYETFFGKVELENGNLIVKIEEKETILPATLKYFINPSTMNINDSLIELVVRYELYVYYGLHIKKGIYSKYYTTLEYLKTHMTIPVKNSEQDLTNRLENADIDLEGGSLSEIIREVYSDVSYYQMVSYINYWTANADVFRRVVRKVLNAKYKE